MAGAGLIERVRHERTGILACLGYALFLAANATVVWGGVFPFLPLDLQTRSMTSAFYVAEASVFALVFLAGVVGAYRRPGGARQFHAVHTALIYLAGWACLIALSYVDDAALRAALTLGGGVFLGCGAARFFLAWQRLFAAQRPADANLQLIAGTAAAPAVYFLLYLIPMAVTALLIALVIMPLFALCIVLVGRAVDLDAPMFADVPREHPQVYRLVLKDYGRSALCMGSVAFSCGLIRALAIDVPQVGVVINSASMLALLVGGLALLALWRTRPLRMNLSILFHVLFPLITSAFILLPVLGTAYLYAFAAVLYAIYGCTTTLVMIQCAQAARDRNVNPVFVYGFVGGITYALHDAGFLFGSYAQTGLPFGMEPLASTALAAVWMLGIMFFVAQGGLRAALSPNHLQAGRIELLFSDARATRRRATAGTVATGTGGTAGPDARTDAPAAGDGGQQTGGAGEKDEKAAYEDRIAKQCALLRTHFKLSLREAEIVEAVVRGYTIARIAERFGVSENTVRTHTKHIYTKLDIHKKQQLIDLVRTFDPNALNEG